MLGPSPALTSRRILLRSPVHYLIALMAGAIALTAVSGAFRHYGRPEQYPLVTRTEGLPIPVRRTFDPALHTYKTWMHWNAMSTGDFAPIFEAARRGRTGRMYRPQELQQHVASFVYTPFAALLVAPLAALHVEPAAAADVVSIVNHCLTIAVFALLMNIIVTTSRLRWWELPVYGVSFLAFYPIAKALELTQASIWILFFLTAAGALLGRGRFVIGGAVLALGVSIKPHLVAIPLVLAAWPAFPRVAIYSCAVALAATTTVSLGYGGMENARDYVFSALPALSAGYAYFPNQSVNGLLLRSFTAHDPAVFTLAAPVGWIRLASTVYGVTVLAITALLLRRHKHAISNRGLLLGFSAAIIGAALASPVLWEHHFAAFVIPFAAAAGFLRDNPGHRNAALEAVLLVSFLLIAVFVDTQYLSGWPLALLSGFQHYGGLLLLACIAWLLSRCASTPAAR